VVARALKRQTLGSSDENLLPSLSSTMERLYAETEVKAPFEETISGECFSMGCIKRISI
jgi:hypothetical protein